MNLQQQKTIDELKEQLRAERQFIQQLLFYIQQLAPPAPPPPDWVAIVRELTYGAAAIVNAAVKANTPTAPKKPTTTAP